MISRAGKDENYTHHHLSSQSPLVSKALTPLIRSKPLQIWDKCVRNGHIKRITDPDIQSSVLEIMGTNVSTNYITCPADANKTLGIKLPFLVMIIKNVSNPITSKRVPYSSRNTSPSRSRSSMIRTLDADSAHQIISQRPESSPSYVPCP